MRSIKFLHKVFIQICVASHKGRQINPTYFLDFIKTANKNKD